MSYYAYILTDKNESGVCSDWAECERKVKGVNARYKRFSSKAGAEEWLSAGAAYDIKIKEKPLLEKGIYFDAGTGRGNGVEISVTDERGIDLLHLALPKSKINKFGKHLLSKEMTNNYGELLACKYALKLAIKKKIKKIFGDSKLVIEYWSKGFIKKKELPPTTVKLAAEVKKLREAFDKKGGTVGRISGDHNPADLGFH